MKKATQKGGSLKKEESQGKTYLFILQKLAKMVENFTQVIIRPPVMSSTHGRGHGNLELEGCPTNPNFRLERRVSGKPMKTL